MACEQVVLPHLPMVTGYNMSVNRLILTGYMVIVYLAAPSITCVPFWYNSNYRKHCPCKHLQKSLKYRDYRKVPFARRLRT